jgi:hypothetical protein
VRQQSPPDQNAVWADLDRLAGAADLNLATGRLVTVPGHAVTNPVDVAW